MSWWTDIFGEPDDWRFVGQIEAPYHYKTTKPPQKYSLTYYLYENQDGERKIDVIDSDSDRGDINVGSLRKTDWVFRSEEYRKIVHPWLGGFRNPDFPTYDKVKQRDMKRLLKGGKNQGKA